MIDVGVIRGSNRLATRAVAAWAYAATDAEGNPRFSGIRYVSRLGDHECWAIFDGSDVREVARSPISRVDSDVQQIATSWGLTVF